METNRLSDIPTLWSDVLRANDSQAEDGQTARHQLLDRYGGAVRRYLRAALHDPDGADELFQVFACRFLSGALRGADRSRGRFRDFVKGVLFHIVADYHNERKRQPQPLAIDPSQATEESLMAEEDNRFLENWRAELLARAWSGLQAQEEGSGPPFYTVLRFRADHPELRSHEIAAQLSTRLGRELTPAGVRKTLERARDKFAQLLLHEVRQSLEAPTPQRLEQELIDLGLYEYCRAALEAPDAPA
jgi:RNA polymerase sigma-70 factor (ECF subfamily)